MCVSWGLPWLCDYQARSSCEHCQYFVFYPRGKMWPLPSPPSVLVAPRGSYSFTCFRQLWFNQHNHKTSTTTKHHEQEIMQLSRTKFFFLGGRAPFIVYMQKKVSFTKKGGVFHFHFWIFWIFFSHFFFFLILFLLLLPFFHSFRRAGWVYADLTQAQDCCIFFKRNKKYGKNNIRKTKMEKIIL